MVERELHRVRRIERREGPGREAEAKRQAEGRAKGRGFYFAAALPRGAASGAPRKNSRPNREAALQKALKKHVKPEEHTTIPGSV